MDSLVLGIDGGGTKTTAWLAPADRGHAAALGIGNAGPSNVRTVGVEAAWSAMLQAANEAFRAADRPRGAVRAACLALAGSGDENLRRVLRMLADRDQLAERVVVLHDAAPALASVSSNAVGMALLSGTGSFAFGRDRRGHCARAGGAGWLAGDEGSAFDLAREALRAVARAADGRGPSTVLTSLFLERFKVNTPTELFTSIYHGYTLPSDVAAHAELVTSAAELEDPVAREILAHAAAELARCVRSVVGRLALEDPIPFALSGSVFVRSKVLRHALEIELVKISRTFAPIELVTEPAAGAVELARALLLRPFEEASWWP